MILLLGFSIQVKSQIPASGPLTLTKIADSMLYLNEITSADRAGVLSISFLNGRSNMIHQKPYKISDWYGYAHIFGPIVVCSGRTMVTYQIPPVTNATSYKWTFPVGWILPSIINNDTITVTAGSSGGIITVKAVNTLGLSAVNSLAVTMSTATKSVGDTAIFGIGVWNVYGFIGGIPYTEGPYCGYYTESNLSYNTTDRWDMNGSPSDAIGWQGTCVPINYHEVVSKRINFPSGHYRLDIPNHDNEIQVFINGSKVFACPNWDGDADIWEGDLNSTSKIEVKHWEGTGGSTQSLKFTIVP